MSRRSIIGVALLLVSAGAFYTFRPDRLLVDIRVDEPMPGSTGEPASAAPTELAAGRFHSNAHETDGTATIYRLAGGDRLLRLTGLATSNGPDVQVYLVAADDVNEDAKVAQATRTT